MTWETSLCKWYFQGQAVDTAADLILERSKSTNAFKTKAKVALIWLGISVVIAASFNPIVPTVAGFAISALGLVPFVKPLFCSVKSLITDSFWKNPLYKRVQIIAWWILFGGLQAVLTYLAGPFLGTTSTVPIAIALSNLTLNGAIYFTKRSPISQLADRSSRLERFDDALRADCDDLRKQEDDLRAKLNVVDDFVEANPELAASFSEAFAKDKQNIAGSLVIPPTIADDTDLITRRTNLKLLVNELEHGYLERVEFVQRNAKFQACFLKHLMSRRIPARVAQIEIEVEADPVKSS